MCVGQEIWKAWKNGHKGLMQFIAVLVGILFSAATWLAHEGYMDIRNDIKNTMVYAEKQDAKLEHRLDLLTQKANDNCKNFAVLTERVEHLKTLCTTEDKNGK